MTYDKKQVADRLCYWREFMQSFHLPTWEELPDLELYMDQVVSLVIRYVNLQPHSALKDSILTASAVNNYVRLKLIPPPVKKRYSRIHLAYEQETSCDYRDRRCDPTGPHSPGELGSSAPGGVRHWAHHPV